MDWWFLRLHRAQSVRRMRHRSGRRKCLCSPSGCKCRRREGICLSGNLWRRTWLLRLAKRGGRSTAGKGGEKLSCGLSKRILCSPQKIVILSAAGTSRSEVPAESKDPYTLSRPQVRQGILPVKLVFLARYSERSAKLRFLFCPVKRGLYPPQISRKPLNTKELLPSSTKLRT